jgi:hypothetical protein
MALCIKAMTQSLYVGEEKVKFILHQNMKTQMRVEV